MVWYLGSELKYGRKKVATDEISVIQILGDDFTFDLKVMVLHGTWAECNIDVQWETCDDVLPISTYITDHTIPIQVSEPLDWSFDVHLIEIDDVHTDVVYSNVELNGIVLKQSKTLELKLMCCLKQCSRLCRRNASYHCTQRLVSSWWDMEIKS